MEALDVGAAHDLHDAITADAVEVPQQARGEVAEHVDAIDPAERDTLERPQQDRAGVAHQPATVQPRHPGP